MGTAWILLGFLLHSREKMFEVAERIQGGASRRLRAADFTVEVKEIPKGWSSDRLRAYFERWGEVVHVGVSLNYRELILAFHATVQLRNRHTDNLLDLATKMEAANAAKAHVASLQAAVEGSQQASGRADTRRGMLDAYKLNERKKRLVAARKAERHGASTLHRARKLAISSNKQLKENESNIKRLMCQKYECTGYAYVTYNMATAAQAALAVHQKTDSNFSSLFGGNLRVTRAPDPEDVLWENLQYSKTELKWRSGIANVIIFLLCILGTAILVATNVATSTGTVVAHNFILALCLWVGQTLVIVFGHVIVIIGTIVLANTLERHRSHGQKERAIMLKVSFFQVLNNVITVFVVVFYPNSTFYEDTSSVPDLWLWFPKEWYPTGAALIVNSLLGDLIVIGVFIDCIRPPDLVLKYILAPRAKTQGRMNELFSIPADITLSSACPRAPCTL